MKWKNSTNYMGMLWNSYMLHMRHSPPLWLHVAYENVVHFFLVWLILYFVFICLLFLLPLFTIGQIELNVESEIAFRNLGKKNEKQTSGTATQRVFFKSEKLQLSIEAICCCCHIICSCIYEFILDRINI